MSGIHHLQHSGTPVKQAHAPSLALLFLFLSFGIFSGCGKSQEEELELFRKKAEIQARADAMAQVEADKIRAASAEREAIAKAEMERVKIETEAKVQAEKEQRDWERQRQDQADRERSEIYARRKAAADCEAGFRGSLMKEGTYVLVLRNVSGQTADFKLRCYTTSGSSKTFNIAISPGESYELGYLEGWPGNFVSGEYAEAYFGDEKIWIVRCP